MKSVAKPVLSVDQNIHLLPRWISHSRGETPDSVAFTSGAALAMLDVVLRDPGGTLPSALLRDRMALEAAVACLRLENRRETATDIRDSVCLARAGEALGPAGDMFMAWRKLARINLGVTGWRDRVVKLLPDQVVEEMPELGSFVGSPVGQAGQILEVVLRQFPRQEAAALMLADAALTKAVGWDHLVPLLSVGLKRHDLRKAGDELRLACHQAVAASASEAVRMASDLTRRADRLRSVAPKLRAKGAGEAVELFLSRDALSPSVVLSELMSDRAARRLCDRLVKLGVARELTGRDTFRLYGL